MNNVLEICTDASIRKFPNGRIFGCAGALSITTMEQDLLVSQDTTNNRAELLGVYLGLKLGKDIMDRNPGIYDKIVIFSDSQFAIFGLTKWMSSWIKTRDNDGIIYGSNNKPVKNQELFMCILSYMVSNNLKVEFKHVQGHVKYSIKTLKKANDVYFRSNGEYLRPEDVYKLAYYNNMIDNVTREHLNTINPDMYPEMDYSKVYQNVMAKFVVPNDYKNFIGD